MNNVKGWMSCRLRSTLDDYINLKVRAIVVDRITSDAPRRTIPSKLTVQIAPFKLADPSFFRPGPIDMLVGIDLYPKLIKGAPIETQVPELFLMPTALGDVVMGGYPNESRPFGSSFLAQDESASSDQVRALREIEEPRVADLRRPDDVLCEDLFTHTHSRTQEGRYVVRRPVRPTRSNATLHVSRDDPNPPDDSWVRNNSSLQRLLSVTARILRLRQKPEERASGPISASEYARASQACTQLVQRSSLPSAIYGSEVPKEFRQLRLFVDELGLVRVGGRIHHADIAYDQKHPLLLPYYHHFTRLVIDNLHTRHFHAGPTMKQSLLRAEFRVPRALKMIKSRIYQRILCRKLRAKPTTPLMADLPRARLECIRAFHEVGVDHAGPLSIRESNRRKAALGKAYICIFICMATKAVHLELVSSLSTDAFLAALDRFVARRGVPSTLHSDNGTNFVGASRNIEEPYSFVRRHSDEFVEYLSAKGVDWKFIPPRAPNFGGLWEAGVKSVKSLLVSSAGKQPLTFEELTTILARIEGLLNSRPLCPLREGVDEFQFLTPGHFMKGDSFAALPTDPTTTAPLSITSRRRLVQQHTAHIWSRWKRDYLHLLLLSN